MSIKILARDHRHAPMVVCDVCGDGIWNANEGVIVFDALIKDGERMNIMHAHRSECHDKAEELIGKHAGWHDLGAHMYQLCANLEIDEKRFAELKRLDGTSL